ncbi:hypothetical protein GCM10023310_43970 [Paenibacillus vulneris]
MTNTDKVTDGNDTTFYELPKMTSGSQSVLSFSFDQPQTITAFKAFVLSYDSGTAQTPLFVINFYDSSNVLITKVTNPSFYGSLFILGTPVNNVSKVTLVNNQTAYSTKVYEFETYNKTFDTPEYSSGLLVNKSMNIISPAGTVTSTTGLTDKQLNTYMTFGKKGSSNSGVYINFPSTAKINAYQLKSDITTYPSEPFFNLSSVELNFYNVKGELITKVPLPTMSGHVISLETPVTGVAKVELASSTYIGSTKVYEVEVFGSFEDTTPPIEPVQNGRAILTITLLTGQEKEFDLSMQEVNEFIAWYEAKNAGSGTASFAIDKHDNNKGPFKSRKDYIIFDKILTFEVSEYENKN